MISIVVQCIDYDKHSCADHLDCIGIKLLMINIVTQCVGITFLMRRLVVQCNDIILLMICIVVLCNRIE